jgi:hypothetical protein
VKSRKLALLMCGGFAVGGVVALVPRLRAQTRDDAVHVCAAADGVLRVATGPSCPAGQTSLYLATAGPLSPKGDNKQDQTSAGLQKRIDDLEQRVAELEEMANKGELGNRVTAPFVVTDENGRPIFRVERDLVRLYNSSLKPVAAMYATDEGGAFVGRTADGTSSAIVGAIDRFSGVEVRQGTMDRIQLGQFPNKRVSLKVLGASGALLAGIGQGALEEGIAIVADTSGNTKAELQVTADRKGEMLVMGAAGKGVAALTEGSYGGNLGLWSVDGTGMVDAGVTADGLGVVRTGPNFFKPGMGVLGLPGSYIIGKR